MKTVRLKAHPAAEIFEMMTEPELEALAADIRQRGQLEPIVVATTGKEDLILDGRNRYEACRRAGVEPYLLTWDEELSPEASATAFVLSKNLLRRHLNESQRALVAAEALPMFEAEAKKRMAVGGRKGKGVPRGTPSVEPAPPANKAPETKKPRRAAEAAAKTTGSSSRSVARAKAVLEKRPDLRDQIRSAKITLKQAEKAIKKETALKNVLEYRPPVGTYAVIVTDVSWEYDDKLDGSDEARGGVDYATQKLDEILAMKMPAAPDCALWFWVTNAFLIDGTAARVLEKWGFEPKALLTWRKVDKAGNDRLGSGHYLQNNTEHVILAVRGKPVIMGAGVPSCFDAPRTSRHSEKPEEAFRIFEKVTPCAPEARIELFAIKPREGWQVSGSEQQAAAREKRGGPPPAVDPGPAEEAELVSPPTPPRMQRAPDSLITWVRVKGEALPTGQARSGWYRILRRGAEFRWVMSLDQQGRPVKDWPESPAFASLADAQADAELMEHTRQESMGRLPAMAVSPAPKRPRKQLIDARGEEPRVDVGGIGSLPAIAWTPKSHPSKVAVGVAPSGRRYFIEKHSKLGHTGKKVSGYTYRWFGPNGTSSLEDFDDVERAQANAGAAEQKRASLP